MKRTLSLEVQRGILEIDVIICFITWSSFGRINSSVFSGFFQDFFRIFRNILNKPPLFRAADFCKWYTVFSVR